jgi:phenylpropionate dioxygenase-like ring-hydroxylating dioxygenase large terminal subunit
MRREEQIRLIREALAAIDRGSPPLAESWSENRAEAYTSSERAKRERKALFSGDLPLVVGLSSQVREPGDFITDDLMPVPVIVVRSAEGRLNAFANICRHRGSKVVSGCGKAASRFICPYHAWSYDIDGRLRTIPDEEAFAGLDRDSHGLIALPVEEKHGLVWVTPKPGGTARVDDLLGGLGDDIASYAVDRHELADVRRLRRAMNWKLASDTFWEAYHLRILHKATLGTLFARNVGLFDSFGSCHRLVGIRSSVEKLRGRPESQWDLLPHATILMSVFPNTILVMQSDHLEMYRVFPIADRVDESVTEVSLLLPREDGARRRPSDETMGLLLGVIEEDFAIGEGIQRNFATGLAPRVIYGRCEPALAHFHRSIRRAIGEE